MWKRQVPILSSIIIRQQYVQLFPAGIRKRCRLIKLFNFSLAGANPDCWNQRVKLEGPHLRPWTCYNSCFEFIFRIGDIIIYLVTGKPHSSREHGTSQEGESCCPGECRTVEKGKYNIDQMNKSKSHVQLNQVLIQVYGPGGTSEANRVPHSINNGYAFIPINLEQSQQQKKSNEAPKDVMNLG